MSKLKKTLAASVIAVGLTFSSVSMASQNDFQPAFLQDTGAVVMTNSQMADIQGEAIWIPILAGIAIANIGMAYYISIYGKTAQDRANAWSYIENHPG